VTARAPLLFPVPEGAEVTRCRSCGATVVWVITEGNAKRPGKRMPLSAAKTETNVLGERVAPSHFADCPQANDWRRKR
jgi:hypothetical protein